MFKEIVRGAGFVATGGLSEIAYQTGKAMFDSDDDGVVRRTRTIRHWSCGKCNAPIAELQKFCGACGDEVNWNFNGQK